MKVILPPSRLLRLLCRVAPFCVVLSITHAAKSEDAVAVYSSVSPDYVRTRLADGSFKPETYAFGDGGDLGSVKRDFTLDKMSFIDLARIVAISLANQKYLPSGSKDPSQTDLLIMVYWGATAGTDGTASSSQYQIAQTLVPPPRPPPPPPPTGLGGTAMVSDPSMSGAAQAAQEAAVIKAADDSAQQASLTMTSMANRQRDIQNQKNAEILGYLPELRRVEAYKMSGVGLGRQDIISDVEESRYYVVLLAYDFQTLLHRKERKLRWETRFSIREHGNDFSEQLAAMAQSASRYYGQNSKGLLRAIHPSTTIQFGELKVLGVEPETKK